MLLQLRITQLLVRSINDLSSKSGAENTSRAKYISDDIRYSTIDVVHAQVNTTSNTLQPIQKSLLAIPGLTRISAPTTLGISPSVVAPMSWRQRGYTKSRQIAPRPKEKTLPSKLERTLTYRLLCAVSPVEVSQNRKL